MHAIRTNFYHLRKIFNQPGAVQETKCHFKLDDDDVLFFFNLRFSNVFRSCLHVSVILMCVCVMCSGEKSCWWCQELINTIVIACKLTLILKEVD